MGTDLRFAIRALRKSPVFTLVAVLSLTLGIGANTAIFTLLDQVLLRLLPVQQPERLAQLRVRGMVYGNNWGWNAMSYPMYKDFKEHNEVFTGMFCRFPIPANLSAGGETERVQADLVSGSFFHVLGVQPALGRLFTEADDRDPGGHPLVVLSYEYWRSRFGSRADVINQTVLINGRNMTVVGVAQPGFDGVELGSAAKIFVPMMMKKTLTPQWDALNDRRWRWVNAYGRMKPGVTLQSAQASLQPFMHSMLEMEVKAPDFRNASAYDRQQFLKTWIQVLPGSQGRSYTRETLSTPLWVLMAITGVVLLIACANLANLLLARAAGRQREIAVRLALGASRWQIGRQLILESLSLSMLGGAAGLAFAYWADELLLAIFIPSSGGGLIITPAPDLRVLLFTLAITILTSLLFSLAPMLQSTRPDVASTLKDQAGGVITGGHVGLRKALVASQVALSMLLLIGAGLFARSLANLRQLGPGFPAERLIGFAIDPTLNGYDTARAKNLYRQLTENLRAVPGVTATSVAAMRILEDNEWDSGMTVEGYTPKKAGDHAEPLMNSISPGYFETLGVPILAGRDFNWSDRQEVKTGDTEDDYSPTAIIINEKFAKKFFEGRNPIGRHLGFGTDPGTKTPMEIIGVVKDIKYQNLREEIPEQAFIPYLGAHFSGGMTVYVRTALDPDRIIPLLRAKVRELDPNVPIYALRTTEAQLSNSLRNERLIASLSATFGFLATLLATIGLYGVMAYAVTRRTREIGIRMALGALQGNVVWMVMREVLLLIAIGVGVGLPAALALTRLIRSQLYGLTPYDPPTLALAALALCAVACLAGYLPALRASRVDPLHALRYE